MRRGMQFSRPRWVCCCVAEAPARSLVGSCELPCKQEQDTRSPAAATYIYHSRAHAPVLRKTRSLLIARTGGGVLGEALGRAICDGYLRSYAQLVVIEIHIQDVTMACTHHSATAQGCKSPGRGSHVGPLRFLHHHRRLHARPTSPATGKNRPRTGSGSYRQTLPRRFVIQTISSMSTCHPARHSPQKPSHRLSKASR